MVGRAWESEVVLDGPDSLLFSVTESIRQFLVQYDGQLNPSGPFGFSKNVGQLAKVALQLALGDFVKEAGAPNVNSKSNK